MNDYMVVYNDGTTEVVQQDSIASIAFMNDDIDWNEVVAVFKL